MLSLLRGEMLETRFGVGTNASLSSPSRRVHLAGRSQFLPNESICSEDEVEDRAGVGEQNDGPDQARVEAGGLLRNRMCGSSPRSRDIESREETNAFPASMMHRLVCFQPINY